MAFPDSVKTFIEAVDPSSAADMQQIQQYQSLLESGNFTAAANLLASMSNGIKMNMSAGRFNDVLKEIIEIEKFYYGLNGVRDYIQKNIDAYTNINVWNNTMSFVAGNITSDGYQWYYCIKENGPTTTIVEPGKTHGWESYWQPFLSNKGVAKYPIQAEEPEGQVEGDLWFEVVPSAGSLPEENPGKDPSDSNDENFWPME